MPEAPAPADAPVSLDNSPELAMPALHRAVIGRIGNDYYLPIFSRFEAAAEATLSWNWSACFFNVNWMLFRGLWGAALLLVGGLLGLGLLLVTLSNGLFDWPPEVLGGALLTLLALGFLLPGAWGNALFYNHSRKAMVAAIEANPTLALACAQLERQASSRSRFVTLLVANALLLALAGGVYVMLLGDDAVPKAVAADPPPAAVVAPAPAPADVASVASDASVASVASASASASAAEAASAPESALTSASSASSPASAALPVASAPELVTSAAEPALSAVPAAPNTVATPAREAVSALAAAPTAAPTAAPAAKPGFFVNAGLFANPENASKTLTRLKAAGLPAASQVLTTAQGPRTRVRVGPFAKRAQAEAAVNKIKALKLDAALAKP